MDGGFPLMNFKSVMLSDRPPPPRGTGGGAVSGSANTSNNNPRAPAPFTSMVRMRASVGLQPARDVRQRRAEEANPSLVAARRDADVVGRHKRWLREQQRAVARAREEEVRELARMEERSRRFKEDQARRRVEVRIAREDGAAVLDTAAGGHEFRSRGGGGLSHGVGDMGHGVGDMGHGVGDNSGGADEERRERQLRELEEFRARKQAQKQKGKVQRMQPKWALTEEAAEAAEDAEVEDLLDFAEGLDYAAYIEDYDVREALSLVKARVAQLERRHGEFEVVLEELEAGEEPLAGEDIVTEDNGDGTVTYLRRVRRPRRRMMISDDDHANANATGRGAPSEEELRAREDGWVDPSYSRAPPRAVRAREGGALGPLRRVHSRMSARSVAASVINENAPAPPPLPPLRTVQNVVIEDDAAATKRATVNKKAFDPSQLPYLYRNPAI